MAKQNKSAMHREESWVETIATGLAMFGAVFFLYLLMLVVV